MAQVGTGSRVEFVTSALVLDITNISLDGVSVPVIDTSHHLTPQASGANNYGARTKTPGLLAEPGALKIECFRHPDAYALLGVVQTIRLTEPGGDVEEASGFVSDISAGYPMEGVETMSLSIQRSGNVTQT